MKPKRLICSECEQPFERLTIKSRAGKCEPCRAMAKEAHRIRNRTNTLARSQAWARKKTAEGRSARAQWQGIDVPDDGTPQTVEGVVDIEALYFVV